MILLIITVLLETHYRYPGNLSGRLTKDSNSHAADFDPATQCVGDGALIGAAVLNGGLKDIECVDDLVRSSLFHLNCIHSLESEETA